jgi:hypothetical protein
MSNVPRALMDELFTEQWSKNAFESLAHRCVVLQEYRDLLRRVDEVAGDMAEQIESLGPLLAERASAMSAEFRGLSTDTLQMLNNLRDTGLWADVVRVPENVNDGQPMAEWIRRQISDPASLEAIPDNVRPTITGIVDQAIALCQEQEITLVRANGDYSVVSSAWMREKQLVLWLARQLLEPGRVASDQLFAVQPLTGMLPPGSLTRMQLSDHGGDSYVLDPYTALVGGSRTAVAGLNLHIRKLQEFGPVRLRGEDPGTLGLIVFIVFAAGCALSIAGGIVSVVDPNSAVGKDLLYAGMILIGLSVAVGTGLIVAGVPISIFGIPVSVATTGAAAPEF